MYIVLGIGLCVVPPVLPLVCSIMECYVWTYVLTSASAIIIVQSYL